MPSADKAARLGGSSDGKGVHGNGRSPGLESDAATLEGSEDGSESQGKALLRALSQARRSLQAKVPLDCSLASSKKVTSVVAWWGD